MRYEKEMHWVYARPSNEYEEIRMQQGKKRTQGIRRQSDSFRPLLASPRWDQVHAHALLGEDGETENFSIVLSAVVPHRHSCAVGSSGVIPYGNRARRLEIPEFVIPLFLIMDFLFKDTGTDISGTNK